MRRVLRKAPVFHHPPLVVAMEASTYSRDGLQLTSLPGTDTSPLTPEKPPSSVSTTGIVSSVSEGRAAGVVYRRCRRAWNPRAADRARNLEVAQHDFYFQGGIPCAKEAWKCATQRGWQTGATSHNTGLQANWNMSLVPFRPRLVHSYERLPLLLPWGSYLDVLGGIWGVATWPPRS